MPAMSSLLRATLSISAATVLSRVTGYGRIVTMAVVLSTGLVAQAYGAAGLLPSLIYELLLGGIMYSIFIPVLIERMTNHGEDDARRLTNALFTVILPLMAVVTLVGILFAEPFVELATRWEDSQQLSSAEAERVKDIAVLFFRIFAIQMLFYGINTLGTGVLQAHRRFFLPTFAPALNNLFVICSFVAYALVADQNQTLALYLLAGGTTVGVAVMALALVPTMIALGYVPRPQFGHPALGPTMRLAGPMVILVAASVGFQFFATFLASEFDRVAELNYAFTIFSLPYGIFAVAIATALLPELSERYSLGDSEGYLENFSLGLRSIAFVMVPATVGTVALAGPIVGILYQYGAFGPEQTRIVSTLLAAYAVGLLGYSAYFFLVRSFYSRQNTKTPAVLNVAIFFVFVGFSYALSRVLYAQGIALALSAAYAALALASLWATRREIGSVDGRRLLTSLAKFLAAGAAMYAAILLGTSLLGTGSDFVERAGVLVLVGGVSVAVYLGVALFLRAEELEYVVSLIRRRVSGKAGNEEESKDESKNGSEEENEPV
ncbi:murein biosynthesis integral membrane protein MurJ [Rubrobacter aplysinae]|uniref:murein biosynthesis integral membrane protein MurJ n=1 Tax=Rubrobacter aplysinae TaxID=909625 RepID=UPI00064C0E9E|nr:murein biosynthesis integral membrane protein MurJ [Rubrobacter aplysinae]